MTLLVSNVRVTPLTLYPTCLLALVSYSIRAQLRCALLAPEYTVTTM